jgi:hypothetical protein
MQMRNLKSSVKNQHCFMKKRSTVMNLLEYSSFVMDSIDYGWYVGSDYIQTIESAWMLCNFYIESCFKCLTGQSSRITVLVCQQNIEKFRFRDKVVSFC